MEKLHRLQEHALKNEIRELMRAQKRESANPEYPLSIIHLLTHNASFSLIVAGI